MNRRTLTALLFALGLQASFAYASSASGHSLPRIAHAGGGLKTMTYTNSIDALDRNALLYDLFEIDLSFTQDEHLVCMHDWEQSAREAFGRELKSPPTLAQFERLVAQNRKFKNCTLRTLIEWLDDHPGKFVVTDVKTQNVKALSLIAETFPAHLDRFIPQIYRPEEYAQVKALGYGKIIWTLYRYAVAPEVIVAKAKDMELLAITMPTVRAEANLARTLKEKLGIDSYVHTINTTQDFLKYKSLGIAEIYTDWLPARSRTPRATRPH